MQNIERVPIQNLTIYIGSDSCTFQPDGTELTGNLCGYIAISPQTNVPYGYGQGTLFGYGTNTAGTTANTTFGFGYGYNNSVSREFEYEIAWSTPDVAENTPYDVRLDANAEFNSTTYTYSTTETSYITVKALYWRRTSGGSFSPQVIPPTSSHQWSSILPEGSSIMNIDNPDLAFTKLLFNVGTKLRNVEIIVEGLEDPLDKPKPDASIYQYLKIHKKNMQPEDMEQSRIRFRIDKTWLDQNNLKPKDVVLYKYTNKWIALPTQELNTEYKYVHFEAQAPSFSLFAIGGQASSQPAQPQVKEQPQQQTTQQTPAPTGQTVSIPQSEKKSYLLPILIFFIVLIVIGGVIAYLLLSKPTTKQAEEYVMQDKPKTEVAQYIQKCRAQDLPDSSIKKALLASGWPEEIVDEELKL